MSSFRFVASLLVCLAATSADLARAQPGMAPSPASSSVPPSPPAPLLQPIDPWLAREQQLEARQIFLSAEAERLEHAGRPGHFELRRTGGYVALGVGGTLVLGSAIVLFLAKGMIGPHSSPSSDLSRAGETVLGTAVVLGLVSAALGGVSLATANHGNPNRGRVRELSLEQRVVQRQIKEARRERKLRRKYAAAPQLSLQRGQYVGLTVALTL